MKDKRPRAFRRPLGALPRPLIRVLTKESLKRLESLVEAQKSSGTQAEPPTVTSDCNRAFLHVTEN